MKTFSLLAVLLICSLATAASPQLNCDPSGINSGAIAFSGTFNPNGINTITSIAPASSAADPLPVEYIWLKSLVNVPNTLGNPYWSVVAESQNLAELTVSGLTNTTYFIRCARLAGCQMYWGETNIVTVPVDLCAPAYIHGGSIAFSGNYNPNQTNTIVSTAPGSSSFGSTVGIEYIWMQSDVNVPNTVGNPHWSPVAGSENQLTLTVSGLTHTKYFIRCARAEGCEMYWGETNIVTVPVDLCAPAYIQGGSIAFTGNYNPNRTNTILSTAPGSSSFGSTIGIEYIWMQSDVNVPNIVGNPHWSPVAGSENQLELTLSGLTHTKYFIRCARAVGCEMYWGETNIVTVPVDLCAPAFIQGGSIAFSGTYNPNQTNTIVSTAPGSSSFGPTVGIEYIWMQSDVNVPNTVGNPHWSPVAGSENQLALTLSGLTHTKYFIRCARAVGCQMYWGETNIVTVPVDLCAPAYIQGGSIAFTGNYNPNQTNTVVSTALGSSSFGSTVGIEYIWMQSDVNVPNTVGNPHWSPMAGSENQLELTLSGLTHTKYFIRCARAEGCEMYWGETNIVTVPVDLCTPAYIQGGSIAFNGNYNPNQTNTTIVSTAPGSSSFGSTVGIEYIWMQSDVNVPNTVGNPHWSPVAGSENQLELTLIGLTHTKYFIRCARAEGCEMYWGETNIVEVPIDLCTPDFINGGSISFSGSYNPNGTNIISSVEAGSSDFGSGVGIEYIWMQSDVNVPNTVGNPHWSPVVGSENQLELTVSGLTHTAYFIRCARAVGCETYWGETNIVTVPVDLCAPAYIQGGSIAFNGNYNPNQTNTIVSTAPGSSSFGSTVGIEYIWMQSDVNVPNIVGNPHWSPVAGSENQLELTLSGLTHTKYFIRCARAEGCEMYWGETNIVEVPIDLCTPDFINGGSISFSGSYNPNGTNIISSVEAGSSDFGSGVGIEYIWMQSDVNVPNTVGNPHWALVAGSENQLELTVSGLTHTKYFIRCARAVGCETYWGETNIVEIAVDMCLPELIDGGEISFSGLYDPNVSNTITSTIPANSHFGTHIGVEYIWLTNKEDVPFNNGMNGWELVEGSTDAHFFIGNLTETAYFIRCARVAGCETYWGESNIVKVKVDLCHPQFIDGGRISFSDDCNPNLTQQIENAVSASSDFGDLGIEYIWLSNHQHVPFNNGANGWVIIGGSMDASFTLPLLLQTTYFIRCARVAGCDVYWGESNIVGVEVDKCRADFISGGNISFAQEFFDPADDNTILNEVAATSPFGEVEYQWATNTTDANSAIDWLTIPGEHQHSLNVASVNGITHFVRLSRVTGCEEYAGKSNFVTVYIKPPVDPGAPDPLNEPPRKVTVQKPNYLVYPSPATADQPTTLEFMNADDEQMEVRIVNTWGIQSKNYTYRLIKHDVNRVEVSLENLATGIYLMEIKKGNHADVRRLLIR